MGDEDDLLYFLILACHYLIMIVPFGRHRSSSGLRGQRVSDDRGVSIACAEENKQQADRGRLENRLESPTWCRKSKKVSKLPSSGLYI
jgi:hypothetical protein